MKYLNILTALAIGVLASSSGIIQTSAALYTFGVDFSTKEVVNFNSFNQSFFTTTYDLDTKLITKFSGTYFFNSCPGGSNSVNVNYTQYVRVNGAGATLNLASQPLPDFLCSTTPTTYTATITTGIDPLIVSTLMSDDANFGRFYGEITLGTPTALIGRVLNLRNYEVSYTIQYDFNTTYLFNYFLSDTKYEINVRTGSWLRRAEQITRVDYLFTTAGNDEYRLVNTNAPINNLGTLRKKYAVDYNEEFFRGESVGVKIARAYNTEPPYDTDQLTLANTFQLISDQYNVYFLNTANLAQAIVDAPLISFTEEACAGGFLDINVACYVNNAIAYLVNDAPVISDAFTLLNTGIELAAQTFGIIGAFTDDNVFGYLILVGFGFIAVKWFLKNDE